MTSIKKKVQSLERNNSALFLKNESFKRDFASLKHDLFVLQDENEKIKGEKLEYKTALEKELTRIRAMKPWKRFLQRGKLLWNLIKQLEQGFKGKV